MASGGWNEPEANSYEEETLESLEEKLGEYRESLHGVKEALAISPDEPELEKLVKDLHELVTLYEDLVELRRSSAPKRQKVEECPVLSTSANTFPSSVSAAPEQPVAVDVTNPKSLLFRACYAFYEGVLYTATVVDVHVQTEEQPVPKVTVEYIGWGNREVLSVSDIQFIPIVSKLSPGATCWAINPVDGLWHLATVSKEDPDNGAYLIRFKGNHESQSILADQISIRMPAGCISPESFESHEKGTSTLGSSKPAKEIITPAGYRIPEKLAIKPQDPERVKQIKKKKISLIKKVQRKELIEQEAVQRQSSWQSHAMKTTKKIRPKQSIFRTSENPDAKVGVTGSGQKMTIFTGRVRHVFDQQEEDVP